MTLYQVSLVMVSSLICTCVSNTLTEEDLKVPQLLHHYDNLLQNFCRDTVTDVLYLCIFTLARLSIKCASDYLT